MNGFLRPLGLAAIAAIAIAAHAEVAGSWALTSEGMRGTNHSVLTIERTEEGYRGNLEGQRGSRELPAITVDGDSFSFELTMQTRMGDIDLSYAGTVTRGHRLRHDRNAHGRAAVLGDSKGIGPNRPTLLRFDD